MRVLILDSQNQNTLAIVRHLGKQGHYVAVVGSKLLSLSFYSKFINRKLVFPDLKEDPQLYVESLLNEIQSNSYDVLLPVGFKSYQLCSEFQDEIKKHTKLTVTSFENIKLASDKSKTYDLANELNIPYPKIYPILTLQDFDKSQFEFPLVIKAPFESGKNIVEYASSLIDAKRIFLHMQSSLNGISPLVQQYIKGDGYGFFAFYVDGKCANYFMHHRIREYPVTGGASVCAESYFNLELRQLGIKILDHLRWEGVAMVEFKRDEISGKFNLMEINPKFWGSLELAIKAGVDFPSYLIDEKTNIDINLISPHYKNIIFQWILNGELFHFLERPTALSKIIRTLPKSYKDLKWSDFKPNIFQFINIFIHYYKKLRN